MKTKFSGILALLLVLVVQLSFAQQKTVTGTVNDDQGLPLPGANVIIKGTSNGTQTDFDGNYSITTSVGSVLQFSYIGFTNQEVTVGSSNTINVNLVAGEGLEEVVIVAYGTQSKETVSSAISVIKTEEIEQVPIASLDQLFQGKAAGLNVQTSSGQPGAAGTVLIRGRSSINGQNEPLFVIDGVPVDEDTFRNINANDIANVSILKDASASALYGNRAAGGVIIITTKQGKFESAPEMTYRSLYGISENINPNFDVLNARQYLTLQRDNNINNVSLGNLANLSDADFEQLINDSADTNWEDVFFRQARTNTQELVWSSGSEKSTTFNSLQYFEQEGITLRSRLQRFSFRTNNSVKVNDKFAIDTQFNASFSTSEFTEDEGTGQLDNPFLIAYLARPEVNAFNEDGTIDLVGDGTTGFSNLPAIGLSSNALDTNDDSELRIIGSVNFTYDILKNVTAGLRTGMDYRNIRDLRIINPLSLRGVNDNTNAPGIGDFKGSQLEQTAIDFTSVTTANITYSNTFGDNHNLEVSAFQEYFKRHTEVNGWEGYGIDPRLIGSGNGIQPGTTAEGDDQDEFPYIPQVFSSTQDLGTLSYFGIARYDYDNQFGLQANIRRDGTSRFSEENRWGTFGAVSAFWNLHKNVLSESGAINELKLRGSYGTVGSQEVSGGALFGLNIATPLFGLGTGYQGQTSLNVASLGNPNARWERTIQRNIGVDFTLFKNRISGSVDAYRNTTSDLFNDLFQSAVTSVYSFDGNFGELQNEGLELALNVNLVENDDFSWNVFGNVGYNVNEVLALELAPGQTENVLGNTALAVGQPIRSFFLVEWAGVNPANGEPLYRDIDGNITNVFDEANRQFSDKTADPLYQGGFGTSLKYKGFYTDVNFSFAMDQWRNNGSYGVLEGGGNGILAFSNGTENLLNAWQNVGDVTSIPALAANNTRLQADTRFLEDASFLRLRNMTFGHKFDLGDSEVLQSLNVYVRGINLLTFTKWRGYDPESNLAGTFFEFPTPRTFSFGVEAKF